MNRMLLLCALALLCAAPAEAKRLAEFQAKYPTKIASVADTAAGITIEYTASATAQDISAIEADKAVFDFNNPAVANPRQFLLDCTADGAIPVTARQTLHIIGLWYKLGQTDLALAVWDVLKASISAPVKTAIQSHATPNNITLPN